MAVLTGSLKFILLFPKVPESSGIPEKLILTFFHMKN